MRLLTINLYFFAVLTLLFLPDHNLCAQHKFTTKRDTTKYSEKNIDVKTFRTFNNINSSFVHTIVTITNKSIAPVSIGAPLGLYISAQIDDNYYNQSSAVLLALSELTSAAFTWGIKSVVKRNRPFRTLNKVNLTDTSDVKGTYSFPSGHSSGSFVIATSLTLRYPHNTWLIVGSYSFATIVALGRMYWGVHYPSDVLVGMIVGAGSAALIYSLRVPIINAKNHLFNQTDRTDNISKNNINTPALLLSIAATDFLNYFFTDSKNSFFNKSKLNISTDRSSNSLSYTFNF